MNKIFQLLLIAFLAVSLSGGQEDESKEPPVDENEFVSETLTILDSYRKNSLTHSDYLEDPFEPSSKLNLPAHLLVN